MSRRIPISQTRALLDTGQRIGVLENRLGPVEAAINGFDAVASEAGTRAIVSEAAAVITLAPTPTAIMAQIAPFAGRRILIRSNPATSDGSYRIDNLSDPKEIVLPTGTTLEAQGDFWIGFRNPTRGGFLLTNSRCAIIAKLRGDYGAEGLHSIDQEWAANAPEWTNWAALWNATNAPLVPLNPGLSFRASWTASYPGQTFSSWYGQPSATRNTLVTVANADEQRLRLTIARTPIGVLAVGRPGIEQTRGHDIRLLIEGDDFIFGALVRRIADSRVEVVSTGTGNGRGRNPQHTLYAANEPTIGESCDNCDFIVNAREYRDAEVVKLKTAKKSRLWVACDTVASVCTIGEGSDVLIKQYVARNVGLDAISDALSPAIPVGLRILGDSRVSADCVIEIEQKPSTPERSQDDLVCVQISESVVNFPLGLDLKVGRIGQGRALVRLFGVTDSVFGPSRFVDTGNAGSLIYSLAADGDGESCDRNSFSPVSTVGTNRIAALGGRSSQNSFLIDEAIIDGGYVEGRTFVNGGFGYYNRASLLGGTTRYTQTTGVAPELMTRATATFAAILVPTFDNDGNSTFDYANVAAGDTVTIGAVTYTFVAAVGELNVANRVLRGASAPLSLRYLARAINGTASATEGPGLTHGTGTVAHPLVTALQTGPELVVRAVALAAAGNGIAVSDQCANASWEEPTLAGGGNSDAARLFRYYGIATAALNVPVILPSSTGAGVREGDSVYIAKTDTGTGVVEVRDGEGGAIVGTLRTDADAATFQYVQGKWRQQAPTRSEAVGNVTTFRVSADVVISSATFTNFIATPGLKANTTYSIDARILFQSSALTNGAGFCFSLTSQQPTSFGANWAISTSQNGSVAPSTSSQRASNAAVNSGSVDAMNADMLAIGTGVMTTGLSSGFVVRARTENDPAASTITIKAGSVLVLREVS